jgi:tetratricopeptide (TPR) repeat protein
MIDELYFNILMKLEGEKTGYIMRRTLKEWKITEHLEKGSEYLIFYFIIKFSKSYLDHLMNVEKSFSNESSLVDLFFESINFEKVLEWLKNVNSKYFPIISLYYYRILAFKYIDNELYYRQLKKLFYENYKSLGRAERFSLIYTLENVTVMKINKGISNDTRELFDIYDFQVKNNLHKSLPQLPITAVKFRNIVVVAIGLKEIDWAEKFVKDHGNELLIEIREQIISICYSYIYFSRKDFEQSLEILKNVNSGSYFYNADVKMLTIQNYYELGYYEEALSAIESYGKTLRTGKQIPEWHKKAMLGRITLIADLIKAKIADDSVLIRKLKEKLKKFPELASKWILEKFAELSVRK